jgi:hypothetical protein
MKKKKMPLNVRILFAIQFELSSEHQKDDEKLTIIDQKQSKKQDKRRND